MSTRIHADHPLPCTVDEYWAMYFDPEFNDRLRVALELAEHRELYREEEGDLVRTRVRVVPRRDLPAAVRKAVPGLTTAYEEERTFDRAGKVLRWRVISDFRPEAVYSSGTHVAVPSGATCRRVLEGHIAVRIFGIGGLVEKAIAQDVERCYGVAAEVGRAWFQGRSA